jgi:hypothetical protein
MAKKTKATRGKKLRSTKIKEVKPLTHGASGPVPIPYPNC